MQKLRCGGVLSVVTVDTPYGKLFGFLINAYKMYETREEKNDRRFKRAGICPPARERWTGDNA
jgi:hypothetical protein